jgi:formate hydrogenlyase subunit 3/multisubunit Na+/H+ antiporter MnhD subunit
MEYWTIQVINLLDCLTYFSFLNIAVVFLSQNMGFSDIRAGYVYLIMASFGTLALLLTFGLLAGPDGGYAFADMRGGQPSAALAASILVLALVGAGSKAGLVPLHVWLPLAHPAAPSHVSALMSGVMTKVAVYGFVRIVFDLLGTPDWWWSMLVLALGGVAAAMGVLYALMQHDLKRLLAYHRRNIGIIFVGLGLARIQARMSLAAAHLCRLYVFNHSVFEAFIVLRRHRDPPPARRANLGSSSPHTDGVRLLVSCGGLAPRQQLCIK